jgi:hypothetical protein
LLLFSATGANHLLGCNRGCAHPLERSSLYDIVPISLFASYLAFAYADPRPFAAGVGLTVANPLIHDGEQER